MFVAIIKKKGYQLEGWELKEEFNGGRWKGLEGGKAWG